MKAPATGREVARAMGLLRDWFDRHFSDPQVVGLAIVLLVGFLAIVFTGHMLAPVIASVVIAYLLEGLVAVLQRLRMPRLLAVWIVFLAFMTVVVFVLFAILPLLLSQATQLIQSLPIMVERGKDLLLELPEHYPELFSEDQVRALIVSLRREVIDFGQRALALSLASVVGIITIGVYLVLVPLLVFFFLKDKEPLLGWPTRFLPQDRRLLTQVWRDVDGQIGNYVRGKFIEIIIVWVVSYVTFALIGLDFAMLLGLLVGLSVLIPYVGAVVVTVPVALVAYFQWGFSDEFVYVMVSYVVIQTLDGNVLVPVLFSEVVNLHAVAIIVAILVFGGLWGFWGVFFAIPLATVVQAVLKAWPVQTEEALEGPAASSREAAE